MVSHETIRSKGIWKLIRIKIIYLIIIYTIVYVQKYIYQVIESAYKNQVQKKKMEKVFGNIGIHHEDIESLSSKHFPQPSMKTASSRLLNSKNCCSISEPSSWKSGTSSSTWYPVKEKNKHQWLLIR